MKAESLIYLTTYSVWRHDSPPPPTVTRWNSLSSRASPAGGRLAVRRVTSTAASITAAIVNYLGFAPLPA
ncbi:hypothetical protein E2C01_058042 [Portunus trituberculatus]|uniref:Uncharacterized protein n=1 Tax=Portunus trituberculatus TaxID=210409 RepID=A0A5B7H501_PORTR|nr:hypothetical protein [Portunus trituberculatus]